MKSFESLISSQEDMKKVEKSIENDKTPKTEAESIDFDADKIEKEKLIEDKTQQEMADEMALRKIREALGIDTEDKLSDTENEDGRDSVETAAEDGERLKVKFEAIKNEMLMRDAEMVEKNKEMLQNLLDVVFEQGKVDLAEGDLIEIVKNNKEKIGVDQNGIEKFIQKDGMEKKFIDGINNANTKEDAFRNIAKSLENEFVLATESGVKFKIIESKAMEQAKKELVDNSR